MSEDKKPIILYAEYDEKCRVVTALNIRRYFPQFEVIEIDSGEGLEAIVKRDLKGVKVIVSDNNMPPGRTGIGIFELYSNRLKINKIKCILFCANAEDLSQELIRQDKIYATVDKPCNLSVLKEAIIYALEDD